MRRVRRWFRASVCLPAIWAVLACDGPEEPRVELPPQERILVPPLRPSPVLEDPVALARLLTEAGAGPQAPYNTLIVQLREDPAAGAAALHAALAEFKPSEENHPTRHTLLVAMGEVGHASSMPLLDQILASCLPPLSSPPGDGTSCEPGRAACPIEDDFGQPGEWEIFEQMTALFSYEKIVSRYPEDSRIQSFQKVLDRFLIDSCERTLVATAVTIDLRHRAEPRERRSELAALLGENRELARLTVGLPRRTNGPPSEEPGVVVGGGR